MSTACPQLQTEAIACADNASVYNEDPQKCFCPQLADASCADVCQEGRDTAAYLKWALSLCGNFSAFGAREAFTVQWKDYAQLEHTALANLLPWSWVVQYDPRYDHRAPPAPGRPPLAMPKCPSQTSKLTSFMLINLAVCAFSLVFGRRTVVNKLSRGRLGKPEGSGTWILTSLFFLALSIVANFANAAIVRAAPGFGGASAAGLALLWCSRPRLAWAAAIMVYIGKERGDYFTSGASALLSEVVLQLLGAAYLVRTVNFAAVNDLYLVPDAEAVVRGWHDALLMYVGALLWICAVLGAVLQVLYTFSPLRGLFRRAAVQVRQAAVQAGQAPAAAVQRQANVVRYRVRTRVAEWFLKGFMMVRRQLEDRAHHLKRLRPSPVQLGSTGQVVPPGQLGGGAAAVRPQRRIGPRPLYQWEIALQAMGLNVESLKRMRTFVFLMILPFIGQWMFWAGFVRLAGDR
jgi:hypothetical protein